MTTIMDELEAPVRANGNESHEWTPAVGFDEVDSTLRNYSTEDRQPPEQARGPSLPSVLNDQRQKTLRLDESLRPRFNLRASSAAANLCARCSLN